MFKTATRTLILSNIPYKFRNSTLSLVIPNVLAANLPGVRQNATLSNSALPTSAYVHLPFCRKRCHYCDFPIIALGSSFSLTQTPDDPRITSYIQLLIREIMAAKSRNNNPPLETVYFGGGTPSMVPPALVSSILVSLTSQFGLCSDAEISMEMDPGTFDATKMRDLMYLGVNRISLGVQAFQDEMLRNCGRAHGLKEVYEAIEIVSSCEVQNWSMDLISSLPHQTLKMWEESLQLTIQACPTHVSVYDLQVEQDTKFGMLYKPGESPLPSEAESANLYRTTSERLVGAGYNHYEISSFCKEGFECKHNNTYWENRYFYGFGLGAASFVNGTRFSRPKSIKEYTDYVQRIESSSGADDEHAASKSPDDMAMDVVMLSLRTARGLDLKRFGETFGDSIAAAVCEAYRPYVESGHVVFMDTWRRVIGSDEFLRCLCDEKERKQRLACVRLSDPDGFLLSNELICQAFRKMDT